MRRLQAQRCAGGGCCCWKVPDGVSWGAFLGEDYAWGFGGQGVAQARLDGQGMMVHVCGCASACKLASACENACTLAIVGLCFKGWSH